jgi:hypothetical protein
LAAQRSSPSSSPSMTSTRTARSSREPNSIWCPRIPTAADFLGPSKVRFSFPLTLFPFFSFAEASVAHVHVPTSWAGWPFKKISFPIIWIVLLRIRIPAEVAGVIEILRPLCIQRCFKVLRKYLPSSCYSRLNPYCFIFYTSSILFYSSWFS